MAVLEQEKLNEIRQSVDIVEVVSNYIPLEQKGSNFFGICPFHNDHSPSMSVSPKKQMYKCFSCGAAGNVYNFLMDFENIPFLEAVSIVAQKAGINLDLNLKQTIKKPNHILFDVYELSHKFYYNNIFSEVGKSAKKYLLDRGIDDSIIKEFGIGLAINKKNLLTEILLKKYQEADLVKSGLLVKTDYGFIDLYKNRIMFPLFDLTGKIIGYSGRTYKDSKEAKYINTMETEIFKKGEILYNYHRAKDEARIKKEIIVVEGFLDVIALYKIGIYNVVATMGTAVTNEQVNLIKKLSNNVILLFDGDSAGEKATFSAGEALVNSKANVKIVRLENNLDPDDFIKSNGKEKLLNMLKSASNFIDFKLNYLKKDKDLTNTQEKAEYVNKVIIELNEIEDDILKELTISKLSAETGLDISFIKSKIKNKNKPVSIKPVVVKMNKYQVAERNLIYYMLKYPEVIKIYNNKITYMPTKIYRILAREISAFYKIHGNINIADLITFIGDNKDSIIAIGDITSLELKENYSIEEIEDYIKVIHEFSVKNENKRLTELIKVEVDNDKKTEMLQKILELKLEEMNDK